MGLGRQHREYLVIGAMVEVTSSYILIAHLSQMQNKNNS
jgi:hypothetical protein